GFLTVPGHLLSADPSGTVLAAHDIVVHIDWMDRLQDLELFIAYRVGVEVGRWFHGRDAEQLQQVILKNIAQRARGLVILAASLDADVFRHGDLNVVDIATIPDRLKDAIGEAEN